MNFEEALEQVHREIQPDLDQGHVASYIPELADVSPRKFGMAVMPIQTAADSTGDSVAEVLGVGDAAELLLTGHELF